MGREPLVLVHFLQSRGGVPLTGPGTARAGVERGGGYKKLPRIQVDNPSGLGYDARMARRSYNETVKGKLYCIEWPEWHVECAADGCREDGLVSPLGEESNLRDAEKRANAGKGDQLKGWVKRDGRWYCPAHA
jgi:hypothetical protein